MPTDETTEPTDDSVVMREERDPRTDTVAARVENRLNLLVLLVLGVVPIVEIIVRTIFRAGIPDANDLVQNTVLLVGFVGGMLAAREGQHLSVSASSVLSGDARRAVDAVTNLIAVVFTAAFAVSAAEWWITAFGRGSTVWFVPIRFFAGVVPVGFIVMSARFVRAVPEFRGRVPVVIATVAAGAVLALGSVTNLAYTLFFDVPPFVSALDEFWFALVGAVAVPLIIVLVASAFVGTPLFVVLTGTAYLLFARDGGIVAVVPNEGYSMLTSSSIPAIPMFTFVGYVLSESSAGKRLFRLFKAVFGWMPGGMVVASILVSVFFATFTGASGVVILALGGLLYTILHRQGRQSERFTVGLLTGVGDLGLLFPPSLVLILYATIAQVSVIDMFLAGLLPGLLTVAVFCVVGVVVSIRNGERRYPFDAREALAALRGSGWEIALPILIVAGYFSGVTTLVETGAVALLYVVIVELFILREISVRDLVRAGTKSAMIMGGVLVILAGARALSYYIIDSRLPFVLVDWVSANISSRIVFLLLLNAALLVTGMFMDIFSAVMVVVPLITPLGALFGIDPVHLGVVFVANMALGFITPPVGLELFLASYRFGQPLSRIYRAIIPFFLLQLAAVLVITYVPWFSTVFVGN